MTALRKRGDSQSFGVYNRLQGTLAKGSCLTLPRGYPRAEVGGGERALERNCRAPSALFLGGSLSRCDVPKGVPGESDLVTSE